MKQKFKKNYKLILKKEGRFKKPFYSLIITNAKQKFIEKIGTIETLSIKKTKKIHINKFLLIFWLTKGAYPSMFLSKMLHVFLHKNF